MHNGEPMPPSPPPPQAKPAPTPHETPKSHFATRDQRLPASPPLPTDSGPASRLMAGLRARYRHALSRLFGSPPAVLNAPCAVHQSVRDGAARDAVVVCEMVPDDAAPLQQQQKVAKRRRTEPCAADQVVPRGSTPPMQQQPQLPLSLALVLSPRSPFSQPAVPVTDLAFSPGRAVLLLDPPAPPRRKRTLVHASEPPVAEPSMPVEPVVPDERSSNHMQQLQQQQLQQQQQQRPLTPNVHQPFQHAQQPRLQQKQSLKQQQQQHRQCDQNQVVQADGQIQPQQAPQSPQMMHAPSRKRQKRPSSPPPPSSESDSTAADLLPQSTCTDLLCTCANSLWTSSGVGPDVMLNTAAELSDRINLLYARAIDPRTNEVDYASLLDQPDFHHYLRSTRKLRYFDPLLLNDDERKTFFLNVYNSLMIHAIAVMSKPQTMFDRICLYNSASYDIGGRKYSLNAIEHGVLRANRPGTGPFAQQPFDESDARIQCALPNVDPRIHFALNCGARSCPPVRFYEAQNLDQSLDAATRAYLQDIVVDTDARCVTLPKLFQWYRLDFCVDGSTSRLLQWALPYLDRDVRDGIDRLVAESATDQLPFKIVFAPYDWSVNERSAS